MRTASEAAAAALNVNDGENKKQLLTIEDAVDRAVKQGKLECFIYFHPTATVRQELQRLGYYVSGNYDSRNETTIKISWEPVKSVAVPVAMPKVWR